MDALDVRQHRYLHANRVVKVGLGSVFYHKLASVRTSDLHCFSCLLTEYMMLKRANKHQAAKRIQRRDRLRANAEWDSSWCQDRGQSDNASM
jgi:hypothetical protein